jgi:ABC-type molybdate transport system ATPase subunit
MVRAEDILLAAEPPRGLSARNVIAVSVLGTDRIGRDVVVRCAGPSAGGAAPQPWFVRITPAAATALALAEGGNAWLAVKSHSIRVL